MSIKKKVKQKLLFLILFIIGLLIFLISSKELTNKEKYNSIIINFREDIPTTVLSQQIEKISHDYKTIVSLNSIYSIDENVYIIPGDETLLNNLKKSSLNKYIDYIEPNYIYKALAKYSNFFQVPLAHEKWNLSNIHLDKNIGEISKKKITIAVIDTGVNKVSGLQKIKLISGYDFVNNKNYSYDDNGHGTHVAKVIMQTVNDSEVFNKIRIMPLKVLSKTGEGLTSDIADAVRYAADNGADIINMSLGGKSKSKILENAINYAYGKDVVIIAAAGNNNHNTASYPARYQKVIGVSALDTTGNKASYSNFGAQVDISAPGNSNNSTNFQQKIDLNTENIIFQRLEGTSIAAAHVTGVAALIKAANYQKVNDVFQILIKSSRKINQDPFNYFGVGHLDAEKAVQIAFNQEIILEESFSWFNNFYSLSLGFWIDTQAVNYLFKIYMLITSYLLVLLLFRTYSFIFSFSFNLGVILGSSGIFFLKGVYFFDLPQWPFRILGSSFLDLENSIRGTTTLNPFIVSFLLSYCFSAIFVQLYGWKNFIVGINIGIAGFLLVHATFFPKVWGIYSVDISRLFLIINAFFNIRLAYLISTRQKLEYLIKN